MTRHPFAGGLVQGRARRSFWILLAVAIVATGSLSSALSAAPSPAVGAWFAVSAIAALVSIGLAVRVMSAQAPGPP
ncbi:MAG: hypothetical protein ACYC3U_12465, partial [Georgenia sp.]